MASDLTPEELAELRKLLAKSTPGPFGVAATAQASRGGKPTPSMDQYSLRTMIPTAITTSGGDLTSLPLDIGVGLGEADARFFAAMRNHAAKLLDMAERCADYDARLSAVMPADFKDWWQNSRQCWPEMAAWSITNLRQREDWAHEQMARALDKAAAYDKLRESQREQRSSITRDIVKAQNKQGDA